MFVGSDWLGMRADANPQLRNCVLQSSHLICRQLLHSENSIYPLCITVLPAFVERLLINEPDVALAAWCTKRARKAQSCIITILHYSNLACVRCTGTTSISINLGITAYHCCGILLAARIDASTLEAFKRRLNGSGGDPAKADIRIPHSAMEFSAVISQNGFYAIYSFLE